ncbi:hypothetical protein FYJ24_03180 [Actinomycetaceae bacterium WB03_NA08]|uniref:Uncharacterized protein n=1 Tax=Scrofimicrobium canadense TaxID=2652290 RepID=A0A6N7W6B6_9ACTO|nr:hypothetical protein [Scrofimicrobium canadense]MSS83776.1 hypothetical protein [Scrofimicrobium canadense]
MPRSYDLDTMIANHNPVPDLTLTAREQAHAERLLTTLTSHQAKSSRKRRRILVRTTIAAATMLGLCGFAYAAGVTPQSIRMGIHAMRSADAGTVTYADQVPQESASNKLREIAANAAQAPDLGRPDQIAEVHTISRGDGWMEDGSSAYIRESERWDWPISHDVHRDKETTVLLEGNDDIEFQLAEGDVRFWQSTPPLPGNSTYDYTPRPVRAEIRLQPDRASIITDLMWYYDPASVTTYDFVFEFIHRWDGGIGLTASNRPAFFEVLADEDGVTYSGTATDSQGRVGEAFAISRNERGIP